MTGAIDTRARYFRNLIVTVVAIGSASITGAAFARALKPLAGLLLMLLACGLFFLLDARLLVCWRSRLLAAWVNKEIDLHALRQSVNALPKLPRETLASMLATLPSAASLLAEQNVSKSTREAVTAVVEHMYGREADTIALKAALAAIVAFASLAGLAMRRLDPLLAGPLVLLPLLAAWQKRRRLRSEQARILAAQLCPDFREDEYRELVASIDSAPSLQGWTRRATWHRGAMRQRRASAVRRKRT